MTTGSEQVVCSGDGDAVGVLQRPDQLVLMQSIAPVTAVLQLVWLVQGLADMYWLIQGARFPGLFSPWCCP